MTAEKSRLNKTLNFQLLVQFEALVREGNVSRAAERLGVNQSTLSTALARMRLVFDDPLLVRTPRGMVPTARGLELARRTHQVLELLEPARVGGHEFDAKTSTRRFRLIASEGLAQLIAPPLAAQMRALAPLARLSIQPADTRHIIEKLRDQEFDLAIGNVPDAPDSLRRQLLFSQSVCCIVSADHPEIRGTLTMDQFRRYPHVVWGIEPVSLRSIETSVLQALGGEGSIHDSAMRVPNITMVPAVVAATDMIATIPTRIAQEAAGLYRLQRMAPPIDLPNADISMYWSELVHRDPMLVWFRELVGRVVKETRSAG